jgi:hypothetical protein
VLCPHILNTERVSWSSAAKNPIVIFSDADPKMAACLHNTWELSQGFYIFFAYERYAR